MFEEWTETLTLTEASSKELLRVLNEQDAAFMDDLLDGRCGFTLRGADGRSVELIPKADRKKREMTEITLTKRNRMERMIIACTLLSSIWEEVRDCRATGIEDGLLQNAVYAQTDIDRIVWKLNMLSGGYPEMDDNERTDCAWR